MALASDTGNIRYNGTGRAYAGTVGGSNPGVDLGELENFTMSVKVTTEKVKSTRNAARATILEVRPSARPLFPSACASSRKRIF